MLRNFKINASRRQHHFNINRIPYIYSAMTSALIVGTAPKIKAEVIAEYI